jgi:translation initiation factor 3 subunit F
MGSLHLSSAAYPVLQCKVHPLVVFNVLDHYSRRSENNDRVIGTLLGLVADGTVEITNCFPVPHTENETVAVDMEFHRNMFELHQRVAPRETIVGWYATGSDITESSHLLQDFYSKEISASPVHLTIDTALQNNSVALNAYVSTTVTFADKPLLSNFQPIPAELKSYEAEKIGVDTLVKAAYGEENLVDDLQSLEASIVRLQDMLNTVSEYVNNVVSGKVKGDPKIGRFLVETLSELPVIETEAFEKVFNNSIQDVLMVVYLANLTRTQLAVAEKLQALF